MPLMMTTTTTTTMMVMMMMMMITFIDTTGPSVYPESVCYELMLCFFLLLLLSIWKQSHLKTTTPITLRRSPYSSEEERSYFAFPCSRQIVYSCFPTKQCFTCFLTIFNSFSTFSCQPCVFQREVVKEEM